MRRRARCKAGIRVVAAAVSSRTQTRVYHGDDAASAVVQMELEVPTAAAQALEASREQLAQQERLAHWVVPQARHLQEAVPKRLCTQIVAKGPLFRQTQYF